VTDADIQVVIDQIDAAVSKDGAKLLIYMEDPENSYCELIGNRSGYLRAALEFLRAAAVPLEPNAFITPIDFNYLVPSRGVLVKRLSRQNDVEAALPPARKNTWKDKAFAVGCVSILLLLAVCTLIGIGMVGSWIFGK
jgi:hypothetical protein